MKPNAGFEPGLVTGKPTTQSSRPRALIISGVQHTKEPSMEKRCEAESVWQ